MKTVRPKPLSPPLHTPALTPEEGFVLSRIDGRISMHDLVAITGIDEERVEEIVNKLALQGAVAIDVDDTSDTASLADFAMALGMDASASGEPTKASTDEPKEYRSNYPPPVMTRDEDEVAAESERFVDASVMAETAIDESALESDAGDAEDSSDVKTNIRNYRNIYATRFRMLSTDERVSAARTSTITDLFALCFDPEPRVVSAVLENASFGLDHARLIALHHRTSTGLEMVSRNAQILRDALVERRLLRNPQCGETVLTRIITPKNVFQTYKIAIDRDVPELTRVKSRGHLRKKFTTASPADRADFVIRTEGRCLALLSGCTFDAKTTAILCGRTHASVLFVQNIAKFPAAPPQLLAHLVKQPFVRKIAPLRKMLLQHPNMPGEVKRQF
ncbi:MAG: hypothetical protein FWD69_07935 [Polyangiaceae bacterium]|nr:hypothetical protein [Polyangiaceae bacterium]